MNITKADVGKEVWSVLNGWGEITDVELGDENKNDFVEVTFKSGVRVSFGSDGKYITRDLYPTIYWQEMEVVEKKMPPRQVLYWDEDDESYETSADQYVCIEDFEAGLSKKYIFIKFLDPYEQEK